MPVQPSVLRWARKSCGLIEVTTACKIGVPDDWVWIWEAGETMSTTTLVAQDYRGLQAVV